MFTNFTVLFLLRGKALGAWVG